MVGEGAKADVEVMAEMAVTVATALVALAAWCCFARRSSMLPADRLILRAA